MRACGHQENPFVKDSKMRLKRTEKEGETSLKASTVTEVKSAERLSEAAGRGKENRMGVRTLPRFIRTWFIRSYKAPKLKKTSWSLGAQGRSISKMRSWHVWEKR